MPLVLRVIASALARPAETIRYGTEHRDQRIELWMPRGEGRHPICIVLHGGWWRAKRTRTLLTTRPICRDLAKRGWVACNVEYRRVGGGGGWPHTFDDVLAAVHAILRRTEHALDTSRVAYLGHSAGGHLALWAAAEHPPQAVVALAAPSDLEASSDPAIAELMGGPPGEHPRRYATANPIRRLPLNTRILLVHGTRDDVVPPKRSQAFAARATEAGDDVTLLEPDADHRAPIDPASEAWRQAAEWLSRSAGSRRDRRPGASTSSPRRAPGSGGSA